MLFHDVIGGKIHELMPEANYVGGSPEAGDEHNWWVWHVGANFEKYLDSHGWMTEFGFQSFPCPATVNSYTERADRTSVLSPVMKAHQHNGNGRGNEMIVEMMARYFRPAKDFDSTLWLSQINQAYGITMGIEHWRADWPKSSGIAGVAIQRLLARATWASIDILADGKRFSTSCVMRTRRSWLPHDTTHLQKTLKFMSVVICWRNVPRKCVGN